MSNAEDIKKQIDELAGQRFALQMKDHWSADDSNRDHELFMEINRLRALIDEN